MLVILTIIASIFVQVLIGFKSTILNPSYYNKLIVKHNLHDLPQNYVLLSMKETSGHLFSEPICNVLTPSINDAFTNNWIEHQSQKLITQTIDYIKGQNNNLELEVPLKERKTILENNLINNLETKYEPQELELFQIDSAQSIAATIIKNANWPDSLKISQVLGLSETELNNKIDNYRIYYSFIKYTPYCLFILFVVLLLLIGKSATSIKWLGYGILISALITMIIAYISGILVDNYLLNNIGKQSKLLTSITTNPLILVSVIKNTLINSINRISIAFALLGTFLLICKKIWTRNYLKKHLDSSPQI